MQVFKNRVAHCDKPLFINVSPLAAMKKHMAQAVHCSKQQAFEITIDSDGVSLSFHDFERIFQTVSQLTQCPKPHHPGPALDRMSCSQDSIHLLSINVATGQAQEYRFNRVQVLLRFFKKLELNFTFLVL